jgi:hypothetical protein
MTDIAVPTQSSEVAEQPREAAPAALDASLVDDYLANRVEQYAGWYDRKSGPIKTRFLYLRALIVIGGALVPVLVNVKFPYASAAATVVSLMVVILGQRFPIRETMEELPLNRTVPPSGNRPLQTSRRVLRLAG